MSLYKITYLSRTFITKAPSLQNACRKAFRYWIKEDQLEYELRKENGLKGNKAKKGLMLKQPPTEPDGGWKGVEVDGDFVFRSIEDVKEGAFQLSE